MRIGFYGFGSIARLAARIALKRGYEIVGAVDIDPNLVGRDIGEVLGLGERLGVEVSRDPVEALGDADVVIHATGSFLDRVFPQIATVLDMGIDVVSTCETLAYPYYRYPVLARKLDEKARSRNVAVIGTGVNPGFILDTLPIILSTSVPTVKRIRAIRVLDAAKRRESFRKKVGIGGDPREVEEKLRRGELTGHVGYAESALLIADAAGIPVSKVVEEQHVVVAEHDVESHGIKIEKGRILGVEGWAKLYSGDEEAVTVVLRAVVGEEDRDEIEIEGEEFSVKWRSSGTHGDYATASIVLSIAEVITSCRPGLLTMVDIIPFKPFFSRTLPEAR